MEADQEVEHLDVLVVGAGLSGIAAAHHLKEKCPWATWAILEARDAVGGTAWRDPAAAHARVAAAQLGEHRVPVRGRVRHGDA